MGNQILANLVVWNWTMNNVKTWVGLLIKFDAIVGHCNVSNSSYIFFIYSKQNMEWKGLFCY